VKNVVLINGSPAQNSHTGVLLLYLADLFSEHFETKFLNLNDLQLPYNNPTYHKDALASDVEKVRLFAKDIANSSVVVLGTPLYHGSYSGMLKVALDNLDGDAFEGKIVVLVSNASKDRGSLQAGNELVVVCRTMHGDVYYRQVGTSTSDYGDSIGSRTLTSEAIKTRCKEVVEALTKRLAN
jgi:NAD(P)H-dependent FMN reductase